MKTRTSRLLCLAFGALLASSSFRGIAEDIDIFSVDEDSNLNAPNVLLVLDNTANWSRQAQKWPEAEVQGQSEVSAIKQVILGLEDSSVNVGLMEYITGGSAADTNAAYTRIHIKSMNATNKAAFAATMDTIYNNINAPIEKRGSSNPYGDLMWNVYNYLAGALHSNNGTGTPSSLADQTAYDVNFSDFRTPIGVNDTCTRTIVIFIGNNTNGNIAADSTTNVDALRALAGGGAEGDAAVAQIPHAQYQIVNVPATDDLGLSTACFSSATACTTVNNNQACLDNGYTSCNCDATISSACPSTHWRAEGLNTTGFNTTSETTSYVPNQDTGEAGTCAVNAPNTGCTLPTGETAGPVLTGPAANQTNQTFRSWQSGSCAFYDSGITTGCTGQKTQWKRRGTAIDRTVTTTYNTTTSHTQLGSAPDYQTAGCYNDQASCTAANGGFSCPSSTYNSGCQCTTATADTSGCPAGTTSRFGMKGNYTKTAAVQTGQFVPAPTGPLMMDEWARFMHNTGVLVPGLAARSQVTFYAIDVFNEQQSADLSGLWFNVARVGGGKYFQAKNKNALITALNDIFAEVQAVNTAFSSASLPVNATNRAQNENQVFIGVFKPDRTKRPLWFGNLKRYQLISSGAIVQLGDKNGNAAINPNTGFITDCAVSYWTVDSTFNTVAYWSKPTTTDPQPLGKCTTNTTSDLSDLPDGPFVEKGAAAEVLRRGNNPGATPDSDGNFTLNRTMYTESGGALATFNTTTTGLSSTLVDFTRGMDLKDEDVDSPAALALSEPRSTIHGDVVHSRPQPVNYGGSTGVVLYYGSNDGPYRAVKAGTGATATGGGVELWSFIAPEHFSKLQRLYDDTTLIRFFGDTSAGSSPKDYFFDGSTGVYQTFDSASVSTKAWIFPSMRRGGRMLYGFNVTDPAAPVLLWKKGCPQQGNDTGCTAGDYSNLGQTWSIPNVAFIKGYSSGDKPVLIVGGGYDITDDDNSKTPGAATKGRGIFVLDAETGAIIRYFDLTTLTGFLPRGVAADVALMDADGDKKVDYAYAVDTGGNIYRMDFVDLASATYTPITTASSWRVSRVAYTNGSARKFLFPPSLVQSGTSVYVAIGSGDREHPLKAQYPYGATAADAVLNRFYVYKDALSDVDATTQANLDDSSKMLDKTGNQSCASEKVLPSSTMNGWYKNLNSYGRGEQTVTSATVVAGFVIFSTNRPTETSTVACSTSLGEARGYFVNLFNGSGAIGVDGSCGGTQSSVFTGGGLPPSPVVATVPVNGKVRTIVIGAPQKDVESTGGSGQSFLEGQDIKLNINSRRFPIYWYKSSGEK